MTNTLNANKLNTNARKISSFVLNGIIALFLITSGCNGDADNSSRLSKSTVKQTAAPRPVSRTSSPMKKPAPATAPAEIKETVLEVKEEPKVVTYAEAESAFLERNYEQAVGLFTRYTEQKAENPWGFYMLGLSAYRVGDFETARSAYEDALELDRQHVKSWINLSRAHLALGETDEAMSSLDKALALDSEASDAYRLKGRAFHNQQQNNEAIASYKQAIILDETDAWSMNNLALIYIEEEQFDKALPALALAVETKDNVALFFNNLGMVLEHHGQVTAAVEAYQKAIKIDASNQKAQDNLTRMQGVEEKNDVSSIDLAAEAQKFSTEIQAWQNYEVKEEIEGDVDGF